MILFAIEAFAITLPSMEVVPEPVTALSNCPPVKYKFALFVTFPPILLASEVNDPVTIFMLFEIELLAVTSPLIEVVPEPVTILFI